MKLLCFSDLHFFHNRVSYLTTTCSWIGDMINDERPDVVVFLGDLNHTHGYVDVKTLDAMVNAMAIPINIAQELNIPFFAISGNHDIASKDSEENVLSIFNVYSRVECYMTIPGLVGYGEEFAFLFCPYPPSTEKDRAAYFTEMRRLHEEFDGRRILQFCHWEIEGIPYRPGDKVRTGAHAVEASETGVELRVSGHYHHPHVYDGNPPTVIVGSPSYHNYSDSLVVKPRGVLILNSEYDHAWWDAWDNSGAPLPDDRLVVGNWEARWIMNPNGPIYHTINARDLRELDGFSEMARLRLRVVVDSQEDYQNAKAKLLSLREEVETLRVVTKDRIPEVQEDEHQEALPSFDVSDVLADYLSSADTTLDKTRLADAGRRLVEEVVGATAKD